MYRDVWQLHKNNYYAQDSSNQRSRPRYILNPIATTSKHDDFPLLDKLADIPDVAYEVIRHLNYAEVLNLACSCRKWCKTIVNAPQRVKPVVTSTSQVELTHNRLKCTSDRPCRSLCLRMDNIFNMIGAFRTKDVDTIYISHIHRSPRENYAHLMKMCRFLIDHRESFKNFKGVWFKYRRFIKMNYSVLTSLFAGFEEIFMTTEVGDVLPNRWQKELQRVIISSPIQSIVECQVPVDIQFCRTFIEQFLSGQRPNFTSAEFYCFNLEQEIDNLFENMDPNRIMTYGKHKFGVDIFVPGQTLYIWISDSILHPFYSNELNALKISRENPFN